MNFDISEAQRLTFEDGYLTATYTTEEEISADELLGAIKELRASRDNYERLYRASESSQREWQKRAETMRRRLLSMSRVAVALGEGRVYAPGQNLSEITRPLVEAIAFPEVHAGAGCPVDPLVRYGIIIQPGVNDEAFALRDAF